MSWRSSTVRAMGQRVLPVLLLLLTLALPLAAGARPSSKAAARQTAVAPNALSEQQRALQVLNRLGYGPAPGDLERLMQMGVEAYIEQQLHPERLQMPSALTERLQALPAIDGSDAALFADFGPPQQKLAKDDEAKRKLVDRRQLLIADLARESRLLRAVYSPAQLNEVMVDFWFNHFNVFADKGQEGKIWVGNYERDAIRPHALGRFRDLLGATAKHPAMLNYLDNRNSTIVFTNKQGQPEGGLNENYAREVMELHTLGVDGGYTQADVTALARIFTGWGFDPRQLVKRVEPAFLFQAGRHDAGEKQFLGTRFAAGRGIDEGEQALDMLAAHPATARHLSYQLAQYFVADAPPPSLVEALARRWQQTGGDVRAVLATLFARPEFWSASAVGQKFKPPLRYLVSALRATGLPMVSNVKPLLGALRQQGEMLYGCPTPDGYKNTEAYWLSSEALMNRLNFANSLGNAMPALFKPVDQAAALSAMTSGVADMEMSTGMTAAEMPAEMPTETGKGEAGPKVKPPDADLMRATLGISFTPATLEVLASVPARQQAGLILGSPEFMRY